MKKLTKIALMGVLLIGTPVLLTACEEEKTPTEKAMDDFKSGMGHLGDAAREGVEDVKDTVDEATEH